MFRRDGENPLLAKGFNASQSLAHAHASPHRPFQVDAMAMGMLLLECGKELRQLFIGQGVVGFTSHSRSGDDRPKRDHLLELVSGDGGQEMGETIHFGMEGVGEIGGGELPEQAGLVDTGPVQECCDGPQG